MRRRFKNRSLTRRRNSLRDGIHRLGHGSGPGGVLRWVAIAQHDARVLGAQVGGIIAAAAAATGRDHDVAWKCVIFGGHRLGTDGSEHGVFGGGRLPAPGRHQVGALAVVVLGGVDAPHQTEVVHLPGDIGQQLGDLNSRDGRADCTERAAGVGAGLGVPAFELAQTAVHVEKDDPLLIVHELLWRRRDGRRNQDLRPSPPRRSQPSRPETAAVPCCAPESGSCMCTSWYRPPS